MAIHCWTGICILATERYCVGLTGGIGSGKSTVAEQLHRLGAALIDTDVIAHQLTGPGASGTQALIAHFGAAIVDGDGAMDRKAMRERVFADAGARAALEGILHPLIREQAGQQLAAAQGPYVLMVVPLLTTAPAYRTWMQRVLVVDCSETTQVRRVMQRSGMQEVEVRAIMAAQSSRAQRLALADDVIVNDGDLLKLQNDCNHLHQQYLHYAELRNAHESSTMPKRR